LGIKDDAVPLPREVSDIQQHGRVVEIAAGRRHTLVLVLDETSAETRYKAFGFGANELHQLGLGEDHPAAKRAFVVAPVTVRPLEKFHAFKVCAAQPLSPFAYFPLHLHSRRLYLLSCQKITLLLSCQTARSHCDFWNQVFAGGDHSFALGYSSDDSDGEQHLVRPPSVVPSPILSRRSQQSPQDKDIVSSEQDVTKSPCVVIGLSFVNGFVVSSLVLI
jgi:hypothetical protein